MLGADGFLDNDDINNPNRLLTKTYGSEATDILNVFKSVRDEEKIDYYNDGEVQWLGGFSNLNMSEKIYLRLFKRLCTIRVFRELTILLI